MSENNSIYTILILYAVVTFIAYLIGALPFGYILGKLKGIDIREHGSGNIGATNVRRTLGKKYGILCFFLDFLKGFSPVLVVNILIRRQILELTDMAIILAAFASVIGHMWPVYLKFKGGKGVSTIAGILLAIAPLSLIAAGICWALVFYSTRYVSLASLSGTVILPASAFIFSKMGVYSISLPLQIMLICLSILVILRHVSNIKRLIQGTENRFEKRKVKGGGVK